MAGKAQTQQPKSNQEQQQPSPWEWDGTAGGPGPASVSSNFNAHPTQIDEVSNPELKSGDKDDEMTFFKKLPELQIKGTNGKTSYPSFSSALLEGGGGVGKCRTMAVSIAAPSGSLSTGVAEGGETMDDSSFGVEGGDKEEFTFPTLNPLPSGKFNLSPLIHGLFYVVVMNHRLKSHTLCIKRQRCQFLTLEENQKKREE